MTGLGDASADMIGFVHRMLAGELVDVFTEPRVRHGALSMAEWLARKVRASVEAEADRAGLESFAAEFWSDEGEQAEIDVDGLENVFLLQARRRDQRWPRLPGV